MYKEHIFPLLKHASILMALLTRQVSRFRIANIDTCSLLIKPLLRHHPAVSQSFSL